MISSLKNHTNNNVKNLYNKYFNESNDDNPNVSTSECLSYLHIINDKTLKDMNQCTSKFHSFVYGAFDDVETFKELIFKLFYFEIQQIKHIYSYFLFL